MDPLLSGIQTTIANSNFVHVPRILADAGMDQLCAAILNANVLLILVLLANVHRISENVGMDHSSVEI